MNIICDKSLLSAAIDGVSKAVSPRSPIPALEGILLKAEGFQLTLTGYDLEMSITTTIEANVRQSGEMVLSAKLLGDMVRRLPSGEITICTNESGNATIKGGVAEFDILAMSSSDYPELPNHGADHTLTIQAGVLRDMIEKTLYAVSRDDKKPAHTGELFAIEPDRLTVVALDGYRLAIVERPVRAEKSIRIIVPEKTLTEVNKLLGEEDQEVRISANRRFVVFHAGSYTILSRLIEGEFLNYASVIPSTSKTQVVLETRDFIETIERASLIITERLKNPLRILFDQKVTVRCQTSLGKVVDEFAAEIQGEPVEIGFNNRYLLEALRNARCEKVRMELNGPLSPVKILPAEGEDFIYLVLPVRFKND
ncbi:MAG: DNA polymerase III subunit beta [Candidatus Fournierella pullistercoris]|uniref:Beta sliding clamp n=1 Tax=Candidatus Allofournierella pullistercoris TaxID=2838597 RepID=A0A948WU24_9FIRM|nr:DNA polymerase III subunit beta [Candidatus Fournierella pullistercoris]